MSETQTETANPQGRVFFLSAGQERHGLVTPGINRSHRDFSSGCSFENLGKLFRLLVARGLRFSIEIEHLRAKQPDTSRLCLCRCLGIGKRPDICPHSHERFIVHHHKRNRRCRIRQLATFHDSVSRGIDQYQRAIGERQRPLGADHRRNTSRPANDCGVAGGSTEFRHYTDHRWAKLGSVNRGEVICHNYPLPLSGNRGTSLDATDLR